MLFSIGNWAINKAGGEDEKTVTIRMVANSLSADRDDEEILPQAFNKATIDEFLSNGIIDWHHQSVLGRTQEERARAIIGKPRRFAWEDKKPVVYGDLTKAHPIVRDSILPHLEAEQPVFGASVGGKRGKARVVFDEAVQKAKRQIYAFNWNHIAVAALPYVISPGTSVSLVKAYGVDDVFVQVSDVSQLVDAEKMGIIEEIENRYFGKAMQVGAGTDISTYTGGDALRGQSLEGAGRPREVNMLIMAVARGEIKPTRSSMEEYLQSQGINERMERNSIIELFRTAVRSFVMNK